MSQQQTAFRYFSAARLEAPAVASFTSLDEFARYLQAHSLRTVFLQKGEGGAVTHFCALHDGLLLRQAAEGFRTIEDVRAAAGYPDATTYYDAQRLQCRSYADYQLICEAGVTDPDVVAALRATGFIQGYTEWCANGAWQALLPGNLSVSNAHELHRWATGAGFTDFHSFASALNRGFTSASASRLAEEKGYATAADFEAGMAGGFGNAADWQAAAALGIAQRSEWEQYKELELIQGPLAHDQRALLVLLSKLPEKKKVSLGKLRELFAATLADYQSGADGAVAGWFTLALGTPDALPVFLQQEVCRAYGVYDPDGEYFETARLQVRRVLIDGSNAAYSSGSNRSAKPHARNLVRLLDELRNLGFTDILVIVDASLRHRLQDPELLPEVEARAQYVESPAETPADVFLIEYVKKERCLLVSNDTFREWKLQDPWIAQYIDFYRLTFLITDEAVLLPHFEKTH
ncbi:MAG: hypothetical protein EOO12_03505 [Chitinophagaceae bacterium]|nr:MAG: hypothetical protein EOO12_03505 [Chitinophagaceae bacterium]